MELDKPDWVQEPNDDEALAKDRERRAALEQKLTELQGRVAKEEARQALHVHHEHFIEREKARAFDDPRELRAFALKSALESRGWWETGKDPDEASDAILLLAKKFEDYLTGESNG